MDLATSRSDRKPRVLVVEDTDTTRQRIAQTLRRHGYTVDESPDGRDALEKVAVKRFDAILLDLVLPHVDGWQFRLTQLRHPELAQIPTVVVTIRQLAEADRFVLRAADIVQKPFEDTRLLSAVGKACGTYQAPEIPLSAPANSGQLFWSRRGEIACWEHAPKDDVQRWHGEAWAAVPADAGKHRIIYQCQHCAGHRGAIGHRRISQEFSQE